MGGALSFFPTAVTVNVVEPEPAGAVCALLPAANSSKNPPSNTPSPMDIVLFLIARSPLEYSSLLDARNYWERYTTPAAGMSAGGLFHAISFPQFD